MNITPDQVDKIRQESVTEMFELVFKQLQEKILIINTSLFRIEVPLKFKYIPRKHIEKSVIFQLTDGGFIVNRFKLSWISYQGKGELLCNYSIKTPKEIEFEK